MVTYLEALCAKVAATTARSLYLLSHVFPTKTLGGYESRKFW